MPIPSLATQKNEIKSAASLTLLFVLCIPYARTFFSRRTCMCHWQFIKCSRLNTLKYGWLLVLLLYDYWCPVVDNILLLLLLAHSLSPGKKGTRKAVNLISVHSFVVWSFFPFDPLYKYLLLSLIPSCVFTATEEVSSSSRIYLNIAVKTDLGMCWCYMSFTV